MEEGPQWFTALGTVDSAGTRLLSVAGDCARPGVYEIEWGITARGGARRWSAHGRPRGPGRWARPGSACRSRRDARRRIAFEDLPCNGAFTVFDATRDLLDIVRDT